MKSETILGFVITGVASFIALFVRHEIQKVLTELEKIRTENARRDYENAKHDHELREWCRDTFALLTHRR